MRDDTSQHSHRLAATQPVQPIATTTWSPRIAGTSGARLTASHGCDTVPTSGFGDMRMICNDTSRALPSARVQTSPNQSKPVQTSPNQSKPVQTSPNQSKPVQTSPNQSKPVQTSPNQSKPVQTSPNQSKPVQTSPNQSKPVQTSPNQSKPVQTSPKSKPVQTSPNQSKPVQTSPNQSKPVQTSPNQSKPVQTSPNQSKPRDVERLTNSSGNRAPTTTAPPALFSLAARRPTPNALRSRAAACSAPSAPKRSADTSTDTHPYAKEPESPEKNHGAQTGAPERGRSTGMAL